MISIQEFNNGINFWDARPKWPNDLHNGFYSFLQNHLEEILTNENPFNQQLINTLINPLQRWVALRPKSQQYIIDNYLRSTDLLNRIWIEDIAPVRDGDITTIEYNSLRRFIEAVKNIKGTNSYVFPSKFSHFLLPKIFPVYDNTALAGINNNYEEYYNLFRREWNETADNIKVQLINSIQNKIQVNGGNVLINYPYQTKAVEICLIGRQNNH